MKNKPQKMEKVAMVSEDIENENLQKLRAVFPQFVKDGQVDFDALQSFFKKEEILADDEKYGLSWAGKSDAFKAIRVPATGALVPQEEESKNWNATENVFIEGDNLEVLKLLQKHYRGQIKMIYIDPPYNTGKDFIYKDNFTENVSDYYERTGQSRDGIKLTSNMESNGRYHSDWLTMMYPRLFLARNLLKDDGVIFVSIDDNEVANLRMIMDEIFGEENFIADVVVVNNFKGRNDKRYIATAHERLLMYVKTDLYEESGLKLPEDRLTEFDKENELGKYRNLGLRKRGGADTREQRPKMFFPIYINPKDNTVALEKSHSYNIEIFPRKSDSSDGCWRWGYNTVLQRLNCLEGLPVNNGVGYDIFEKDYLETDGEVRRIKPKSVMLGSNYSTDGATKAFKSLFDKPIFNNPKSVYFLADLISYSTNTKNSDIVLDFFAGSGTTAHAVMDLNAEDGGNRKFICVQIPEETDEDSEARKAGYKTIAEISRERIRRAGEKILSLPNRHAMSLMPADIGFKAFALLPSNYRRWNVLTAEDDEEALLKQAKLFLEKPLVDKYDEQSVIYEILLKEGFGLNSKITEMKKGGAAYHKVIDGEKEMNISFATKLSMDQIDSLELPKDTTFVCLDSALNDTTKVNIMRNLRVKTI